MDNWSIEFFLLDKWFNVMVDLNEGEIVQYYCNITKPPQIERGNEITFVDLDFDLLKKNGKWSLLDKDDFKKNQNKLNYPKELVDKTKIKLEDLRNRIKNNDYPFNGFIQDYVKNISQEIFN